MHCEMCSCVLALLADLVLADYMVVLLAAAPCSSWVPGLAGLLLLVAVDNFGTVVASPALVWAGRECL